MLGVDSAMPGNPVLKRLLDAGAQFTEMSQSTAEKLVNEFVRNGQVRRKDAEKTVRQLVDRGRASTEHLLSSIQSEVAKQLGRFADRIDDVEDRIEDLAQQLGLRAKKSAPAQTAPAQQRPRRRRLPRRRPGQEGSGEEGSGEEGSGEEGSRQEGRPRKQPTGSSGVARVVTKKAAKR